MEDRETAQLPTHGRLQVSYFQENRNPKCKSLKLLKYYISMGERGLLGACTGEKSEGRNKYLLKADEVKWSLLRTDKRVLSRRLK